MVKLSILLVFVIVSSGYCQDGDEFQKLLSSPYSCFGDKEFHFDRPLNGSEYDFKYKLDNGECYSGKTYLVSGEIYMMFGANDTLYWIEINKEENNKTEFTQIAHSALRKEDVVLMKNDHFIFQLNYTEDLFEQIPYHTKWDLESICFIPTNSEEQTFNFTILSLNNSRKYYGITYRETDDPFIQRIHLHDGSHNHGVYEIEFIENELASNGCFCSGITNAIFESWQLGIGYTNDINPELLNRLRKY